MALVFADRVKQTSTTTGTGPFALSATPSGFRAFSSKLAVGDTFYGSIVNDDGQWQSGLFTYSAANQVATLAVHESSNADSAVTFGGGTKEVFIGMTSRLASTIRDRLTANRTYYVATTGSDSNDGLTVGTPFLTIQKAVNVVMGSIDLNGYSVTIKLADGTYSAGANLGACLGQLGTVTIEGNTTTPGNVIISGTAALFVANLSCDWHLKGMRLITTSSYAIISNYRALVRYSDIEFGACTGGHMSVTQASLRCEGNYSIIGNAPTHWYMSQDANLVCASKTITITGTPAFSTAFLLMTLHSNCIVTGNTYSGSATGKRYDVTRLSYASTGGATLPGGTAGTTATGGLYE